eukprot:5333324-Pleurochrysis_carterae.AAC.1
MATNGYSVLEIRLAQPAIVVAYQLYTANHAFGRNPVAWTFWRKLSGEWQLLDTRSAIAPNEPFTSYVVSDI